MSAGARPELAALQIADPPGAWRALGFTVTDGIIAIGGVELWLDASGRGITGWTLRHPSLRGDVDGLPTGVTTDPPPAAVTHANGALGIDQVVVTTPDFDRTAAALADAGMELRRIRDAGGFRQGFRRLGPAILELVEVPGGKPTPATPARFWGLVVIVGDLPSLCERLAPHMSEIRDAVQPGRHIAGLRETAGLSPRVAFMDPEPPAGQP
jgi:hypothetical protein